MQIRIDIQKDIYYKDIGNKNKCLLYQSIWLK